MSHSIKFPEEHYVGMITSRANDDLSLAFMTPNGTDPAADKRKASVDRWVVNNSTSYNHVTKQQEGKIIPATILKNEAMAGFRLLQEVRRNSSWGSGNVKWRVEDPRGFELEISSPNLMQILGCTVVDEGEILDQCMWAREGSENILVPVSSEVYTTAVANTTREAKSASLRDVKLGDRVILKNGIEGVYYGKLNEVSHHCGDGRYSRYGEETYVDTNVFFTPRHVILDDTGRVHAMATPKLAEIVPTETPWSKEEAETKLAARPESNTRYTFSKKLPKVERFVEETEWKEERYIAFRHPHDGKLYCTRVSRYSKDEAPIFEIGEENLKAGYIYCKSMGRYHGFSHVTAYSHKIKVSDMKALHVKAYGVASRITSDFGYNITISH